jgi:protein SCO1/2
MKSSSFWQYVVRVTVLFVLMGLGGGALLYWQTSRPRSGGARPLEQLGHFGAVPDFTLLERSERQVTCDDLLGRVWVVNFFYATCSDTCPLQSAKMARLQRDFADDHDLRLVSISVDPKHDTPDVLRAYAQRFGADSERWLFLTGDKVAIYRLAQDGFHLSVVDPAAAPPQGVPSGVRRERQSSLREMLWHWGVVPRQAWAHAGVEHSTKLHSSRFALVDRQARIRGYYHSDEEAALQRLRRDIRALLREKT